MPAWFEAAAQKVFGDGAAGGDDGISIAEMTLVTAAPSAQVAASRKTAAQAPSQASVGGAGAAPTEPADAPAPDIDELAQEVYEEVCRLLAIARERSGDPWQS